RYGNEDSAAAEPPTSASAQAWSAHDRWALHSCGRQAWWLNSYCLSFPKLRGLMPRLCELLSFYPRRFDGRCVAGGLCCKHNATLSWPCETLPRMPLDVEQSG